MISFYFVHLENIENFPANDFSDKPTQLTLRKLVKNKSRSRKAVVFLAFTSATLQENNDHHINMLKAPRKTSKMQKMFELYCYIKVAVLKVAIVNHVNLKDPVSVLHCQKETP